MHDLLLVTLQDGSFHTIHDVSGTPAIPVLGDKRIETSSLTQVVRSVFVEAERSGKERFDRREVMLLSGIAPLGPFGSVVWVHEYVNRRISPYLLSQTIVEQSDPTYMPIPLKHCNEV